MTFPELFSNVWLSIVFIIQSEHCQLSNFFIKMYVTMYKLTIKSNVSTPKDVEMSTGATLKIHMRIYMY